MKRVWYTAWPFLTFAAVMQAFLKFPEQTLLAMGCVGVFVAVAIAVFLRWASYKEPKR